MHKTFRRACWVGSLALLLASSAIAQIAAWPSKFVKFVHSFPPGGPSDILARAVGDVAADHVTKFATAGTVCIGASTPPNA